MGNLEHKVLKKSEITKGLLFQFIRDKLYKFGKLDHTEYETNEPMEHCDFSEGTILGH